LLKVTEVFSFKQFMDIHDQRGGGVLKCFGGNRPDVTVHFVAGHLRVLHGLRRPFCHLLQRWPSWHQLNFNLSRTASSQPPQHLPLLLVMPADVTVTVGVFDGPPSIDELLRQEVEWWPFPTLKLQLRHSARLRFARRWGGIRATGDVLFSPWWSWLFSQRNVGSVRFTFHLIHRLSF